VTGIKTSEQLTFRKATTDDSAVICRLVNSAYRGDSSRVGWTTEADLIEGARITEAELDGLINQEGSIILLCINSNGIVGSVHLGNKGEKAYLGLFVVEPELQGGGIGKKFMQAAEKMTRDEWGVVGMTMSVISVRQELITFYERRGYRKTGHSSDFPTDAGESAPKIDGLKMIGLEKIYVLGE
jgi:GNAT superfamily N-acetyltransferase